jgi:hypothetical protein
MWVLALCCLLYFVFAERLYHFQAWWCGVWGMEKTVRTLEEIKSWCLPFMRGVAVGVGLMALIIASLYSAGQMP